MNYEMKVKLPSGGVLYPENPELTGDITLRMMTTEDEKFVFGGEWKDAVSQLLKNCIVSPTVDPEKLHPVDREFLLLKLRIHTYGADYHIRAVCPDCGHEAEFTINLDDLEVKSLPGDFKEPIEMTLPVCGKKLGIRLLRHDDLDKINKRAKEMSKKLNKSFNEIVFIEKIARRIVSIDNKDTDYQTAIEFVKNLYGRDSAYIAYKINQIVFGYDMTTLVQCPNASCGSEYTAEVGVNTEFFRPRFD